jgi:hypothetical protein
MGKQRAQRHREFVGYVRYVIIIKRVLTFGCPMQLGQR